MDAVADPGAPATPAKDTYIASWCGQANCNSAGFTRGVATNWGGTWTELDMTGLPNRFPNAVIFDPGRPRPNSTVYLVFNGFNRRFIEGPGAGVKHVYRGKLARTADRRSASPGPTCPSASPTYRRPMWSWSATSSSSAPTSACSSPTGAPPDHDQVAPGRTRTRAAGSRCH